MALSRFFNDSFFRSPSIFSNEFHSLFNDLDRLSASVPFSDASVSNVAASFAPRVKLSEHGNEYRLEAEVAGFPKDALNIDFPDPRVLRLSGKYEQEYKNEPSSAEADTSATKTKQGNGAKTSETTEVTTTADNDNKQVTQQSDSGRPRVWHNERISKSFSRSIGLPGAVDVDAVKASLNNGILSIVLPKAGRAETAKRVQIVDAESS